MINEKRREERGKWYRVPPSNANMRIPNELIKCVCYLCVKIQGGDNKGKYQTLGTAFFIGVQEGEWDFTYLITARHLLEDAERIGHDILYARINTKMMGVEYVEIGSVKEWIRYPVASIDLAVIPFMPDLQTTDFLALPYDMLLSHKEMFRRHIGVGDELIVTGLFTSRKGTKRNIPIVRSGIISAMPEEDLYYKGEPYSAYLAELRSIGGLSGSPVYIYLDRTRIYEAKIEEGSGWQIFLIGLIRGHFYVESDLLENPDEIETDAVLGFNKAEKMNVGIALITPSEYILAMLFSEPFKKDRQDYMKRNDEEENSIELDSAITENAPAIH